MLLITVTTSAHAINNDCLVRLLAPANLALMLNSICVEQDASFANRTKGVAGPIEHYAQYVKMRVSEKLDVERLNIVLQRAADIARDEALRQIGKHQDASPTEEHRRLRRWCLTDAARTIQTFISLMDEREAEFDKALVEAKR